MKIAISPSYTTDDFPDFPNAMTIDQKIDVFADRISGWQLGIAKEIIEKKLSPHCAFALLHLTASYFEMIAKYSDGVVDDEETSYKNFKKGIRTVFPDVDRWPRKVSRSFLRLLYGNVRCGLYHIGMVRAGVWITGDMPDVMQYDKNYNIVKIDPDKLVYALLHHFGEYVWKLREPNNVDLRANFERRFDLDNKP